MVARARGPGQALGNAVLKTHCPDHEPIMPRPAVPLRSGINAYFIGNLEFDPEALSFEIGERPKAARNGRAQI